MPLTIDSDFPGGNIAVDALGDNQVDLHQELRDTQRDWFYWYFRIRGAAGRSIRFRFTTSRAIGVRGPAISHDDGATWRWLGVGSFEGNTFSHTFGPDDDNVRFSVGMPYQLADWQRFAAARPWLKIATLTHTRRNQALPIAAIGTGTRRLFIAARHHCCEMMPNYAIEGLIDFLHNDPQAGRLLREATIEIVPMVDLDGVEAGDQGKGRMPHDHGRDYGSTSIYPESAAIRKHLEQIQPAIVMDLHCPGIAGNWHESIYAVGNRDPLVAAEQQRFITDLAGTMKGPLKIRERGFLPFGTDWNVESTYSDGRGLSGFGATLANLSVGIELPYANAEGAEVNAGTARLFGEDLGRALLRYLGI
jgi:hypothetical protein